MPRSYIRKPPVTCSHCAASMTRTRPSKTGLYFCSKQGCQAMRRRKYREEKQGVDPELAQIQANAQIFNITAFFDAALHAERVPCPACGITNGLRGYAHPDGKGGGCGELGGRVNGVSLAQVTVVWPPETTEWEAIS